MQAGEYYRSLSEQDKADLVDRAQCGLNHVSHEANKYVMLSYSQGRRGLWYAPCKATKADVARVKAAAEQLTKLTIPPGVSPGATALGKRDHPPPGESHNAAGPVYTTAAFVIFPFCCWPAQSPCGLLVLPVRCV